MIKKSLCYLCAILVLCILSGCSMFEKPPARKIGISLGAGPAARWQQERVYMEERAKELNIESLVRFNTTDKPKTQQEDCKELIDSGISVLIIMPRDGSKFEEICRYAKSKNVKVIAYARPLTNCSADIFIGYDNYRIGQVQGLYAIEMVRKGNFIILKGDKDDNNAIELYNGIMKQVQPTVIDGVTIICDDFVPGWSPTKAKEIVREALLRNNKQISAFLAPNDKIAGAGIEVMKELGIKGHVIVTGMDAELPAVQRIAKGEQDLTVYLNLQDLANTAVDQADNIISHKKFNVNSEFTAKNGDITPSYLITGKTITQETIDKMLIDPGVYTQEQVYGPNK